MEEDYPLDPNEVQHASDRRSDEKADVTLDAVVADTDGDGIPDDLDPIDDSAVKGIDTRVEGDD